MRSDAPATSTNELVERLNMLNQRLAEDCSAEERSQIIQETHRLTQELQAARPEDDSPVTQLPDDSGDAVTSSTNDPPHESGSSHHHALLKTLPTVQIDRGVFKYVLIFVASANAYFVRGSCEAAYHYECALPTLQWLNSNGIEAEVLGGGRMKHDSTTQKIDIYGFSYSYGMADHAFVSELLKKHLGEQYVITVSTSGY